MQYSRLEHDDPYSIFFSELFKLSTDFHFFYPAHFRTNLVSHFCKENILPTVKFNSKYLRNTVTRNHTLAEDVCIDAIKS